jgi:hypothetical protein
MYRFGWSTDEMHAAMKLLCIEPIVEKSWVNNSAKGSEVADRRLTGCLGPSRLDAPELCAATQIKPPRRGT